MSLTRSAIVLILGFLWGVPACSKKGEVDEEQVEVVARPSVTTEELPLPQGGSGRALFEQVSPERSGLKVLPADPVTRDRHGDGRVAMGGLAIGDLDGDGRADVFVVNESDVRRCDHESGRWWRRFMGHRRSGGGYRRGRGP